MNHLISDENYTTLATALKDAQERLENNPILSLKEEAFLRYTIARAQFILDDGAIQIRTDRP